MNQSSTAKASTFPDQVGVCCAVDRAGENRRRQGRPRALRLVAMVLLATASLGLLGGLAVAATGGPTVTGNPQVDQVLTAAPVVSADSVTWYACDPSGDTTGGPLALDTDTYVVHESDVNTDVCATELLGTSSSNPVGLITDPGIVAPAISGNFIEGQTLTASQATWTESGYTINYQWEDCGSGSCTGITGATDPSYALTATDVGKDVEVQETPAYDLTPSSNAAVPSNAGDTVTSPTPTPRDSSAPSISGTAQLGQTLTADVATGSPATSYAYQWLRCALNCTAIPGAVGATYQLADSDVGESIAVTVTAQGTAGASVATSARTKPVTAPSTLQIVASPPRPLVDQPVTIVGVVTSTANGTDPSGTVAFTVGGSPISGCAAVSVPATRQTVTVSCTTAFPVSSPSLSASFSPAAGSPLLGSSASVTELSVGRGYSTTSLDVPATARRGATTTYTASIAAGRDLTGPVLPAGTVSFLDHGKAIAGCRTVRVTGGGATCTVQDAQIGTQAISARYGGDTDFRGSSSRVKTVQVIAAPHRHTRVLGAVTATMQWTFHYTPSYTRIIALVLHGANPGATVTMHCTGKGCPFQARAHAVAKPRRCRSTRRHTCPAPGTFDLEPSFRHRDLRVHAQITITVTQKRYVGKYYRFSVRARRQPSVKISCLAVGSSRPGVGCSAP